jgi:hypothetical protein
LPRLASNHNPPDVCLLSSGDYRHEPPAPADGASLRRTELDELLVLRKDEKRKQLSALQETAL